MRSIGIAMLVGAIAAAGCRHSNPSLAPASRTASERGTFVGGYSSGFERSFFRPCGRAESDSLWWAILGPRATAQWDSIQRAAGSTSAFVRWAGATSETGPAGHLGRADRYALIDSFVEMGDAPACDSQTRDGRSVTSHHPSGHAPA